MGENEILKKITVFTQNSIRVDSSIGKIYIDPFRMNETPNDADYILVTHDHYDHFNPEDIPKVSKGDSILVVPENMGGTDSSVSAALLCEALGKDRVIGVLMPCGEQHDIDVSQKLVDYLGIKYYTVNIKEPVSALHDLVGEAVGCEPNDTLPLYPWLCSPRVFY